MPVLRAAALVLLLVLAVAAAVLARALGRPAVSGAVGRLTCGALLWTIGVRLIRRGALPEGPRLLVANHVSWIDVLALGSIEPLCFLAKREVAGWPVVGLLARDNGTVFVDRGRRRGIPAANRAMAARLAAGRSLLLFPEGTTHDGLARGPFRTSHLACLRDGFARPDAPGMAAVQAVAVHYSDPSAAWIGEATLLPHLWAILVGPRIVCTLVYGPLERVRPGYDRKALGRRLAAEVEHGLASLAAPAAVRRDRLTWRSAVRRRGSEASETAHGPTPATARSAE